MPKVISMPRYIGMARQTEIPMAWLFALVRRWGRMRAQQRALARLPERSRQILRLTARDGLSYTEVGDRLDISTDTVETELAWALNRLASDLELDDEP